MDHPLDALHDKPDLRRLAEAVGDLFAASVRLRLHRPEHDAIATLGVYIDREAPGYLLDRIAREIEDNGPFPLDRFPGAGR
jgi:hypothetical protein